jgi:uncharacterized membrane protein YqjE
METLPESDTSVPHATRRLIWRLLAFGHNRSELLMVEIQEERVRAQRMLILMTGVGVLALLGGMTLTAIIVLAAGPHYFATLVILAILYVVGSVLFYLKAGQLRRNWESLSGTRDQLRKDRECLEKRLT